MATDPLWSTYLGGRLTDRIAAMAEGKDREIVIVGSTNSANLSPTPGAEPDRSSRDIFVASFDPDGIPLSTPAMPFQLFGGSDADEPHAVVVNQHVYIVGQTRSQNLEGTAPKYGAPAGGVDAFLARTALNGTLEWVMYLGGSMDDVATGVVFSGNAVFVSGWTKSTSFQGATAAPGETGTNAFVVRVNLSGAQPTVAWSKLIGGSGSDELFGAALAGDSLLVVGTTSSSQFPTSYDPIIKKPFQGPFPPMTGTDAFVAKVELTSGALEELACLGGPNNDEGRAITVVLPELFVVAGSTTSPFGQSPAPGLKNALVAWMRINDLGKPKRITMFGGDANDEALSVTVDGAGAYVGGRTASSNFPVRLAYDTSIETPSGQDGFVAFVPPEGGDGWATFVGGPMADEVGALLRSTSHDKLIVGLQTRSSTGLPIIPNNPPLYDSSFSGEQDGYLVALKLADINPPTSGTVEAELTPPNTISASWSGFMDFNSSIERYDWAIGTEEEPESVKSFAPAGNGQTTSTSASSLKLVAGVNYYVTVRAQSVYGLTAAARSGSVMLEAPSNPDAGTDGGDGELDGGADGGDDGGTNPGDDGGTNPGDDGGTGSGDGGDKEPVPPLGWGCASGGGAGLPLLIGLIVLVLLGRGLRPESRS
jgi:hypothetical protein